MSLKIISLANKWRPKKFKNFFGQNHIINTIKNSIINNNLHHSYIFSGPSGVGKTTLARILSKSLNCHNGINVKFCEICSICKSIDLCEFADSIEIDAASNRGVEEISILLENILFKPIIGRYKIYIIDEIHMLSNHAFSIMLKLLEEPPLYVKFILITTDPDKIPITISSRCIHFRFKNISTKKLLFFFSKILVKENIIFKKKALFLIIKASRGNIRDIFGVIQQLISYSNNKITLKSVSKIICLIDEFFIIKLLFFIYKKLNKSLIKLCNKIKNFGFSFSSVLLELLDIIYKIFLLQYCSNISLSNYRYKKKILYFAKVFSPEKLQLIYQIGLLGYNDLDSFLDSYITFSIIILRMSLFNPIFNFNQKL